MELLALTTGLAFLGKPSSPAMCTHRRENALLVDPKNSEVLAVALMELPGSPVLRQRLAAEVQAMNLGDRSWLSIADRTKKAYTACL
jgi:hypothetical protein